MNDFIARLASEQGLLVDASALAAVSLLAYLFGRRQVRQAPPTDPKLLNELSRARQIARELDQVARRIRGELSAHAANLSKFQVQMKRMETRVTPATWRRFSDDADALVAPTVKLAINLSQAYDELRVHQAQLLTFAGSRIDPSTGLQNRRGMEEQLDVQLSMHADGNRRFSLAVFSTVPPRSGSPAGDGGRVRAVAHLIEDCVRGSDIVARYSDDEFAVLMPKTTLAGAAVFCHRLLTRAMSDLNCPLWGGVVEAKLGESADKLLSRVDSALYSARTQDAPCLFQHNGSSARRHVLPQANAGAAEAPGSHEAEETAPDRVATVCGRIG